jgi:hypothetical protein
MDFVKVFPFRRRRQTIFPGFIETIEQNKQDGSGKYGRQKRYKISATFDGLRITCDCYRTLNITHKHLIDTYFAFEKLK